VTRTAVKRKREKRSSNGADLLPAGQRWLRGTVHAERSSGQGECEEDGTLDGRIISIQRRGTGGI